MRAGAEGVLEYWIQRSIPVRVRHKQVLQKGRTKSPATTKPKAPSKMSTEPQKRTSTQTVLKERFQGRLDNIRDGVAYVTLFTSEGKKLAAQIPVKDLAENHIGKSDLFELNMIENHGSFRMRFRKIDRDPIPDDLWKEIQQLRTSYADLFKDDEDGEAPEE